MIDQDEDRQLIKRALAGSRADFDTLINKYYDLMFTLAFKWSGSQEEAEDITHNAFIKVAENLKRFRYDSTFKTWLYRIVINVAYDMHRKKKVRRGNSEMLEIIEGSDRPDRDYEARVLIKLLDRLPRKEKESMVLVAEGLTHAEAAEIQGCKESTVSWRVHEARKKLSDWLGRDKNDG